MKRFIWAIIFMCIVTTGCNSSKTNEYIQKQTEFKNLQVQKEDAIRYSSEGVKQTLDIIEGNERQVDLAKKFNEIAIEAVGNVDYTTEKEIKNLIIKFLKNDSTVKARLDDKIEETKNLKLKLNETENELKDLNDVIISQSYELEEIKRKQWWSKIKRWAIGIFGVTVGGVLIYFIGPMAMLGVGSSLITWIFKYIISKFPKFAYKIFNAVNADDVKQVVKGVGSYRKDKKRNLNSSIFSEEERKANKSELDSLNSHLNNHPKKTDIVEIIRKDLDV